MPKMQEPARGFHVGDRVRVPMGARKVDAFIVEDRGTVGAGGRHLFAVQIPMDPLEPLIVEVPDDEIEPAEAGERRVEKPKIIDYLKQGGLVNILRSNMGGKNQPRVWLRYDTRGNVTHTFVESRGIIGGEAVPFWATNGEAIFLEKVPEVRNYLKTFGLRNGEADDVIVTVGTTPT